MRRVALAILAVLAVWPSAAMCQQAVEDFYRGKKIDMIIGYSSGRHLRSLCPPGRALPRQLHSRQAADRAAQHARRRQPCSGELGLQHRAARTARCWRPPTSRCRCSRRRATSGSTSTPRSSSTSAIRTSRTTPLRPGIRRASRRSTTPRSARSRWARPAARTSSQYPKAMNALLGTKFKIVLGYPGGNDVNLALERGEVDVRGSNSWTSWKATRPDWVARRRSTFWCRSGLPRRATCPTCRC